MSICNLCNRTPVKYGVDITHWQHWNVSCALAVLWSCLMRTINFRVQWKWLKYYLILDDDNFSYHDCLWYIHSCKKYGTITSLCWGLFISHTPLIFISQPQDMVVHSSIIQSVMANVLSLGLFVWWYMYITQLYVLLLVKCRND